MNADLGGLNDLSYLVIGAGHKVSNALGIGFAERTYENALCRELRKQRVTIDQQRCYKVLYDGHVVGEYIPDLVVADRLIVEVKAIDGLGRIERAQCINY